MMPIPVLSMWSMRETSKMIFFSFWRSRSCTTVSIFWLSRPSEILPVSSNSVMSGAMRLVSISSSMASRFSIQQSQGSATLGVPCSTLRHSHGYGARHSSVTVRVHRYFSLPVPTTHHGPGATRCDTENPGARRRWRALQPLRSLLDQDLLHQFRLGRGHRYPHGVSVRYQLGHIFEGRRRCVGANAGNGGRFLVFPRIGV